MKGMRRGLSNLQSGAGHHLVSGSTASTLRTMKSSYFSKSGWSSRMLLISVRKKKKIRNAFYSCVSLSLHLKKLLKIIAI